VELRLIDGELIDPGMPGSERERVKSTLAIKDARKPRVEDGAEEWELTLLGEGEVPVRESLEALRKSGHDGWLSVDRIRRWSEMVRGRGVCHHPDGAVRKLSSVLTAFKDHLRAHLHGQRCYGLHVDGFPQPPAGQGRQ
jgi:hypothetical protein